MFAVPLQINLAEVTQLVMTAIFLVTVVNRLIEGLIKPLFVRFEWDTFYLMYISWAFGAVITALTRIDLFYFIDWRYEAVGYILSALVAGGGANLLHDFLNMVPGQQKTPQLE
jgi:hypothetical protein